MTVRGLDVTRRVVKDEADMNVDGINSNEDEISVKDKVHVFTRTKSSKDDLNT